MTVSVADRAHFAHIATAEREAFQDECRAAAQRTPGENLALALALMEEFKLPSPEAELPPPLHTLLPKKMSVLDTLREACEALAEANVAYAVMGGLAAMTWGRRRTSRSFGRATGHDSTSFSRGQTSNAPPSPRR